MSVSYTQQVVSSEDVTNLKRELAFDLEEKIEETLILNSSSKSIDFSDIDNPRMFLITTSGTITLSITKGGSTITLVVDSSFSMIVDPTDAALITALSVEDIAGTDKTVKVGIYGYTPSA